MEELIATEEKMDRLETLTLKKWKGGNYYSELPEYSKKQTGSKDIVVPAYCKLFSMSSSTSHASFELGRPTQPLHLELLDSKGKRVTRILTISSNCKKGANNEE